MATRRLDPKAIEEAYFGKTARLSEETAAFAARTFRNLGRWNDDVVPAYISRVVPTVEAGQRTMSTLTRAFYKLMAEVNGEPFDAARLAPEALSTTALRGTDAQEVYERGFKTVWYELSKGKDIGIAVGMGAERLYNIVRTDLQLAKTNTGLFIRNNNSNIVGYARVLSGAENCALCYVASTQRYTRGQLMPIHPGCDCGEMPIYGNQDPGRVIDEVNLEATHDAVASRFGKSDRNAADYANITIRQHGEIGPVLTVEGHRFTTFE